MNVRAVLALVALTAAPASAQVVAGVVTDTEGAPLPGATVVLAGPADSLATAADADGRYLLRALGPGVYVVRAAFVGYASATSDSLRLAAEDRVVIDVELTLAVGAIGEVAVEARRQPLRETGFYRRRAEGRGRFVDRQQIEDRRPRELTDLFMNMPGFVPLPQEGDVRLASISSLPEEIGGTGGLNCRPTIVVDGTVLRSFGDALGGDDESGLPTAPLFNLNQALRVDEVEAVEAYAHGGIPAQYGGVMSPCGAILVWTRAYAAAVD